MNRALRVLGKSLLVITGVSYGVIKAMDMLAEKPSDPVRNFPDATIHRLDGMEQRLTRIEKSIEALTRVQPTPTEHSITRAELERALQRLSDEIASDLDRRFEVQNRSVQSLRSMIARTDELLEQVIENIESTQLTA